MSIELGAHELPIPKFKIAETPSPVAGYTRAWRLIGNGLTAAYVLVEYATAWELCGAAHTRRDPQQRIEFAPLLRNIFTPQHQWPPKTDFPTTARTILEATRQWKDDPKLMFPWVPLLIEASTQDDPDQTRRAILALLFVQLIPSDDPDLRLTLLHLRRIAYLALVECYEQASVHSLRRDRMEEALYPALYAWQGEIVSHERSFYFSKGFPFNDIEDEVRVCYFHSSDTVNPRHESEQQRELAMVHLLASQDDATGESARSPKRDSLHSFFIQTSWGRDTIHRLIQGWFLPRYDLTTAERLKAALQNAERRQAAAYRQNARSDGQAKKLLARVWHPVKTAAASGWDGLAAVSRWVLPRSSKYALMGGGCLGIVYFLVYYLNGQFQGLFGDFYGLLGWASLPMIPDPGAQGFASAVYGLTGVHALHWFFGGAPDTSLPRLRAGMLLGVIGTLLQQNWDALMEFSVQHPVALWGLAAALALVAGQSLYTRINVAIGMNKRVVWQRSWSLFWRALCLAFVLSFILVDILSGSYIEEPPCASLPGLVTGTYPSLVLLFAVILLFSGIFAQLLGEERPLTEALA